MSVLLDRKFPIPNTTSEAAVSSATPLADALRELDILPFDPQSVVAYKQEKMEQVCARRTRGMVQFTPEPWDSFAGEVYMSAMELVKRNGRKYGDRENTMLRFYTYQIPTYVPADSRVFLPPFAAMLVWDLVEYPSVPTELPPHIDRKAKQISETVPGAIFETETLRDHSHQYDPFLVVRLGDERYYIEVWDEHDFE
ncbi:MAG TPA: hypothetical protein VF786_11750 [Terriglobales bacterium]